MINALIFQKLSHFFRCEVSRVVRFQFFRYTILTECLMHALNYFFTIYVLEKRHNGIPGVVVYNHQQMFLEGRWAQDVHRDFLPTPCWKRRTCDRMAAIMLRVHGLTIHALLNCLLGQVIHVEEPYAISQQLLGFSDSLMTLMG